MKVCDKCGHENENNELYCRTCGHAFALSAPKYGASFAGALLGGAEEVKKALRSPLFFFAALAFSVLLVLRFINVFSMDISAEDILSSMNMYGLKDYRNFDFTLGTRVFAGGGVLLSVVFCVGLWLIRSAASSESGFTLIKVWAIIKIVFLGILCAFALLAAVGGVMPTFSGYVALPMFAAALLIALLFLAVAVPGIIYYVKLLSLVNSARLALTRDISVKNPPNYIIAVNFISAFISLACMFSEGVTMFLVCLVNIAYLLLITLWLIKFRQSRGA